MAGNMFSQSRRGFGFGRRNANSIADASFARFQKKRATSIEGQRM
jgi:hypothetical protein